MLRKQVPKMCLMYVKCTLKRTKIRSHVFDSADDTRQNTGTPGFKPTLQAFPARVSDLPAVLQQLPFAWPQGNRDAGAGIGMVPEA